MKLLRGFDLQDGLFCLGVASLCGGVAFIYWPAALILLGLICLAVVLLMERAKARVPADKLNGPPH